MLLLFYDERSILCFTLRMKVYKFILLLLLMHSPEISAQTYDRLYDSTVHYYKKGLYEKAIYFGEQAKIAAQKESGIDSRNYANSLNNLALLYNNMGNYTKAEPLYVEAMNIWKKVLGTEDPDYATSMNNLAFLYHNTGNYTKAEPLYVEAMNIWKKVLGTEHPDYALSLNNLAGLYSNTGNYEKAEPLFVEAMNIRKKMLGTQHPDYAQSLNNLAALFESMGNYTKAEPLYVEALNIWKKVLGTEHPDYAQSVNNLAVLYYKMGNNAKAEPLFVEALNIRKQILSTQHPDYAQSLNNLAALYESMGNYTKAEPLYVEALNIRKQILGAEHPSYATSLNNLAGLYRNMGNYAKAEPLYVEAMNLRKKILGTEHPDYAQSLNNLAALYESMGNYTKAEPLFLEALNIRKKVLGSEHPDYAGSLNNLAGLYKSMGNYAKAEPLLVEALNIRKKILSTQHPDYAQSLNNLAGLYKSMGNYTKAEPLYVEALKIWKKVLGTEHPDYATSLNNLAGLYENMGHYAKAEPLYVEALTIWKKVVGTEHPDYALSLNNLAVLYESMGNYTKAEPLFMESMNIRKKVLGSEHPVYAGSLNNLAALYESMGNYAKAEPLYIQSATIRYGHLLVNYTNLSEKEKQAWLDNTGYFNEVILSLQYNYKKITPSSTQFIFNQQLLLKSLVLADTRWLTETIQKSNDSLLQKTYGTWLDIKRELSRQYALPLSKRSPELAAQEQQAEELEKQLNRLSAAFREQQQTLRIQLKDVQNGLQEQEACVEFVKFRFYKKLWTDSVLYGAFVVTKYDTVPRFVPLFEERQLQQIWSTSGTTNEQKVKNLYRGSSEADSSFSEASFGKEVYRLVWQPLEPYLKGITKIAYAPAGLLYKIAFHALPVDSATALMDKYTLRQYTSIREVALRSRTTGTQQPKQVVLFGNPDYARVNSSPASHNTQPVTSSLYTPSTRGNYNNTWSPLSGTAEEIKKIKLLFEQNKIQTTQFVQQEASEEHLKALSGQSPQVLHIATHGFFLPQAEQKRKEPGMMNENQYSFADNPLLRSGLVLAGANHAWGGNPPVDGSEDGIVTAYEIAQLNLSNTELVVLSACETALGDIKGGEGVFGLQRAFKLAGVKKMIVSLWQVPDKETAELMTAFYNYWLKGQPIEQAFARAQSEMRKQYPAFYWAAFVLVE
jgi:CHAT domain-containing protein/Tfp pilus assembly protein PilF